MTTAIAKRLGACLIASVVIGACAPTPRQVVFALHDFSASDTAQRALKRSLIADTIVRALGLADALTVWPIDDASVQQPTRIVDIDLARISLQTADDGVAHADAAVAEHRRKFLDSTSRRVNIAIDSAARLRRAHAGQTDIIGAIQNAVRSMPRADSTSKNVWPRVRSAVVGEPMYVTRVVIVVASDMLMEGRGIDFSHAPPRSSAEVAALLRRLVEAGEVPDLTGVDIIVSGATGASAAQVEHVRAFWLAYFMAAHANLVAYDFDARAATARYLELGERATPTIAPAR